MAELIALKPIRRTSPALWNAQVIKWWGFVTEWLDHTFFLVDCQWETWSAWSSCADSCSAADGNGNQHRSRTVTPDTQINGGNACVGADGIDFQSCSVDCPSKNELLLLSYYKHNFSSLLSWLYLGCMECMGNMLCNLRGWYTREEQDNHSARF